MEQSGLAPNGAAPHERILVVIPTYNEAPNLCSIVERVRASVPHSHLLIVDDNSPDGTGRLADSLSDRDSQLQVLHRPAKMGLGAAYVAGFRWGLDREFSVIVEMDADGSHPPEQLPRLLAAIADGADVAIGSRYVPGGETQNWPRRRRALSRVANWYARALLGAKVRDITAGFRAYRAEVLDGFVLETVASMGYCFQIELAWRAIRQGLHVAEVPITFVERQHGASKMDGATIWEAVNSVTRWGARHRFDHLVSLGQRRWSHMRRDARLASTP